MRRPLKTLLKAGLSVLIVYLVVRAIDEQLLLVLLRRADPFWLLWAVAWFTISKMIAAYRFNGLLKTEGVFLSTGAQLRLYWLGMYYNLLLPGGISGDAYKIKLLMDATGRPFRRLFAITLFDRLSGLIALGQLLLALAIFLPLLRPYWWIGLLGLAATIPLSFWLYFRLINNQAQPIASLAAWRSLAALRETVSRKDAKEREAANKDDALDLPPSTVHRPPSTIHRVALQALAVQLAQLVSTLGIVLALDEGVRWLAYSVLFLLSSVAAMLPLTIGGTGARELTFLWGAAGLGVDAERAVAIAFLFYLISTLVALFGLVFSFRAIALDQQTPSTAS